MDLFRESFALWERRGSGLEEAEGSLRARPSETFRSHTASATEPAVTGPAATVTTDPAASDSSVVNTWVGPAADVTALPLGSEHVSTTEAVVGGLYVCDSGDPNGGGAFAVGPWIDEADGTWDLAAVTPTRSCCSRPRHWAELRDQRAAGAAGTAVQQRYRGDRSGR